MLKGILLERAKSQVFFFTIDQRNVFNHDFEMQKIELSDQQQQGNENPYICDFVICEKRKYIMLLKRNKIKFRSLKNPCNQQSMPIEDRKLGKSIDRVDVCA